MSFSYSRTGKPVKQSFTQYSKDYYLDADGILQEKPLEIDNQAQIDSYYSTRLESILDMYPEVLNQMMQGHVSFSDEVVEADIARSDLEKMLKVSQIVDGYRAENPDMKSADMETILKHLKGKYNEAMKAAVAAQKGVVEDEKASVEEGKQEELHETRNEG